MTMGMVIAGGGTTMVRNNLRDLHRKYVITKKLRRDGL
jgi:hypothetical protein